MSLMMSYHQRDVIKTAAMCHLDKKLLEKDHILVMIWSSRKLFPIYHVANTGAAGKGNDLKEMASLHEDNREEQPYNPETPSEKISRSQRAWKNDIFYLVTFQVSSFTGMPDISPPL